MMPEMDGFEFLASCAPQPDWRDIPVLVVTAKDLTAEDRDRLNGGVERVIQKSAERDEMLREVRARSGRCVERGRRERTARHDVKILYVEDNEDNVYVLKNRLTRTATPC